jgi:rubrerythrin
MSELTLAAIDRDEALGEAMEAIHGSTRAGFLRSAALGGTAMLTALAAPSRAVAGISDVQILQFGLRFERLQATFYTQADELGTIARMVEAKRRWARTLGAHERAHVKIIKQVLGPDVEPRPFFSFGDAIESGDAFTRTAVAMEDLTVALLAGVAPAVQNRKLTAALFGLLTVEARHAAWARNIVGSNPAPEAMDKARSLSSVRAAVARTHFIVNNPRMAGQSRPKYAG